MTKETIIRIAAAAIIVTSLACSIGSGDSGDGVSRTIEAALGGTITSQDGAFTVEIPPGALREDTEISIRAVSAEDLPSELSELAGADRGYLLEPEGLTFSQPVAVNWEIDIEDLVVEGENGYMAQALVSWGEEAGFEPLTDLVTEISIDDNRAVLRGTLEHFSYVSRDDGALTVDLVEVNDEQLVGTSFNTSIHISLGVRMHGVVLAEIGGHIIATGQVALAGSGDFKVNMNLGQYSPSTEVDGFYRCESEPGPGTYGATVHALVTWEAGPSSADRVLQVTLTSDVNCVAELTSTESPPHTAGSAIGDILIEMGFSADQVNTLEQARREDDREDWLYSIAQLPPGLRQDYLDLLWLDGYITNAEYAQVQEWFNDSLFPCGEMLNDRLTVCSMTAGDFPEGEMLVFAAGFDGTIPLDDPEHHYVFALVLDGDGDPANNFQFVQPYNWDYYQGTDQWYELGWNPQLGDWFFSQRIVRGSPPIERHTDARAVIAGDLIIFFIPASEVAVEMPAFRITSFGHDGTYALEVSGGDVSGADPTEPLIQVIRLD